MFLRGEAKRKQLGQGTGLIGVIYIHHVDQKIVLAELPHHLPADAAGREHTGNDAVLTAADSDGHEVPVAVIDGLEESGALGADGGGKGCVLDIAALVHRELVAENP